jgi:hypothetical protein
MHSFVFNAWKRDGWIGLKSPKLRQIGTNEIGQSSMQYLVHISSNTDTPARIDALKTPKR